MPHTSSAHAENLAIVCDGSEVDGKNVKGLLSSLLDEPSFWDCILRAIHFHTGRDRSRSDFVAMMKFLFTIYLNDFLFTNIVLSVRRISLNITFRDRSSSPASKIFLFSSPDRQCDRSMCYIRSCKEKEKKNTKPCV